MFERERTGERERENTECHESCLRLACRKMSSSAADGVFVPDSSPSVHTEQTTVIVAHTVSDTLRDSLLGRQSE